MKTIIHHLTAILPLAVGLCTISIAEESPQLTDPGWPREFTLETKKLTVFQPQIDEWKDHSTMRFRCAIEVDGVLKEPTFGVAEIEARTLVDNTTRVVQLFSTKRDLRFADVSEAEAQSLRDAVDTLRPPEQLITVSLDRVIACLDPESAAVQKSVDVNLDPPKIFYSNKPAVLVIFMGEPQFKPVVASDPGLMFALNTNWDVFYQPSTGSCYLLNEDHWLTSTSAQGPWTVAANLPDGLNNLPADDNWAEIRKHIPGKPSAVAEQVFASKQPAELLVTTGDPEYKPIPNTRLLEITNTDSVLLLDSAGGKFYYQVAGRWFRAPKLDGAWEAASTDLPADFQNIPDDSELAFIKASVPGTEEAKDAVLLASVPQSTYVDSTKAPTLTVSYKGGPVFQPIPPTSVKYAVNSPNSVFLVNNGYYCCDQGVWFSATTANGPWAWATSVPPEIYQIPVSSPAHNVTYVTVKESTPDTVVYTQTAGYSGEYVAANGVLMFGAGLLTAAIINNANDHYCYPPASWYSYGCGAVYHYGYGGYYGAAGRVYGPYGGAGHVPPASILAEPTLTAPPAAPDTAPPTILTPAPTPPKVTAPLPTARPPPDALTIPTRVPAPQAAASAPLTAPRAAPPLTTPPPETPPSQVESPERVAAPQAFAPTKAPVPRHGTPATARAASPKPETTTSMPPEMATFTKRTPMETGVAIPVADGSLLKHPSQNQRRKPNPSARPPARNPTTASRSTPCPAPASAATTRPSAPSRSRDHRAAAVAEEVAAAGADDNRYLISRD